MLQDEQVVDIPGLNGEEIIVDLCEQIAGKLRRDCNLRHSDNYVNGYSADVTVKIRCFGIDTAEVEMKVPVEKIPAVKTAGQPMVTEHEIEIAVAHEPDLEAVRERSEQTASNVEKKRDDDETAEKEEKTPARRRYAPRVAGGVAGGFSE